MAKFVSDTEESPGTRPRGLAGQLQQTSPAGASMSDGRQCRLSMEQESVLLGHLMSPRPEIFNVPLAVNLSGVLNQTALQEAFNVVVQRHEVLRTRYFVRQGLPCMCIDPATVVPIRYLSSSGAFLSYGEQVWKFVNNEAKRVFDLEQEWPVRVTVICTGPERHILLIVLHHIACDEFSLSIFRKEIAAVYAAFVEGRPWIETPLPVQYSDYAEEQYRWMKSPEMRRELAFWRKELAAAPASLSLDGKRNSATSVATGAAVCSGSIDAETAAQCLALCAAYRTTPFVLLIAALSATLRQHTGADDVLIGTPISTRAGEEMESLIGYFVNTIVLRTKFERSMTFIELLQQTRASSFRMFAHRNILFQKVVEELAPAREPEVHPFFRVMMSFHRDTEETLRFGGLTATQLDVGSNSLKCDLLLSVRLLGSKLKLECEFNSARFDAVYAQRLMAKFTGFLRYASLHPTAALEECYGPLTLIDRQSLESQSSDVRSRSLALLGKARRVAVEA